MLGLKDFGFHSITLINSLIHQVNKKRTKLMIEQYRIHCSNSFVVSMPNAYTLHIIEKYTKQCVKIQPETIFCGNLVLKCIKRVQDDSRAR